MRNPEPQPPALAPAEVHAGLRDTVSEAGSAVAALTERTADETVARTRILIPAVRPSLGTFEMPPPIDPPTVALRQAGEGVWAGLEPVTDSGRRAVGLLFKELSPAEAGPKGGL